LPREIDFADMLPSASLTAGTVLCIAPSALASAVEVPRLEASINALWHEETSPQQIVDIGGGIMATPVRSSYQTDTVALRMIMPVLWILRTPSACTWMASVTW
jgi:hypothetical protein